MRELKWLIEILVELPIEYGSRTVEAKPYTSTMYICLTHLATFIIAILQVNGLSPQDTQFLWLWVPIDKLRIGERTTVKVVTAEGIEAYYVFTPT
ncbi:hypothetical protein [Thermofilum sp.]|uniref:hypothetical protein n=1 Tax=Thermofilum sp. TaxID=1961369 RepID=UPI002679607C